MSEATRIDPERRAERAVGGLAAVLALLNAVGPVSTDMYLPAFAAMRASLGGDASFGPTTLTAWFAGLALGQLVLGPLSDRLGRRPPLMLGAVVYVAGSLGCALASTADGLIAFRCLAAIGGAASLVVPRAIIRDHALDADDAARIVARIQVFMSVVPAIIPVIGGIIVERSGWRAIFLVQVAFGLACLLAVVALLPESLPAGRRLRISIAATGRNYGRMMVAPGFPRHAAIGAAATFGLFCYLGAAPAVFLRHLGWSPTMFGLTFIGNGFAYACGTWVNPVAMRRIGAPAVLWRALLLLVAASGAMVALAASGDGGWGLAGGFVVAMFALGFVLPGAAIGAIGPHTDDAGIASALYGTLVFAVGAAATVAMGMIGHAAPVAMTAAMLGAALVATGLAARRS